MLLQVMFDAVNSDGIHFRSSRQEQFTEDCAISSNMLAATHVHSPCLEMQIQSETAKERNPEETDARMLEFFQ